MKDQMKVKGHDKIFKKEDTMMFH